MIRVRPFLALFAATLSASAWSQSQSAASMSEALAQWRANHGASWRAEADQGTGYAQMLYGGSAAAEFEPADEQQWFALARHDLALAQSIHGIEAATLVEHKTTYLPLGMVGTTDKMTVRFRQEVDGVPVDGGWVNVLFDAHG